ncbi:MAG: biopolymer transporter ExbD [Hyphomicrobiales bacterium]|nr:biopolymer transporter ExbD [Rickettsiales bacterium]MCP5361096.1 biopolymer transporter ExbD [Hyphomicrobiales bacterium]
MEIRRSYRAHPKVGLTPLIDLVFLLVVFFMLSTTFISHNAVSVGFADSAGKKTDEALVAEVRPNAKVSLTGKTFSLFEFPEALLQAMDVTHTQTLVLRSHKDATIQDMMWAVDQAGKAGVENLLFAE